MHKRQTSGFTIIEVSLFLALSGFLMVGLIATANSSISRQRYNDSVNDVAEYIRGVYSEVINVSMNPDPDSNHLDSNLGRDKNCAVYGKMIVLDPGWNAPGVTNSSAFSQIKTYTILGDIYHPSAAASGTVKDTFVSLNLHVRRTDGAKEIHEESTHNLPWQTSLENPNHNTTIKKAIIILRSPTNGSVYTYYYDDGSRNQNPIEGENFQNVAFPNSTTGDVDICIDSPDNVYDRRRNLRIHTNASGSSGVDLVAQDGADNRCGIGNSNNAPDYYSYN